MPRSHRYRQLEKRVYELRKHPLPSTFHPTGVYSLRTIDRLRAFQLLVHAEFEAYLEDAVLNAVNDCCNEWVRGNPRIRRPLVGLLSWYRESTPAPPDALVATKPFLHERVKAARSQFARVVNNNQGIRTKNVMSLLLPAGIRETDIDREWLDLVDQFGKERGEIAHNSKVRWVVSQPDPKTELERVKQLLMGFKKVDLCLTLLQRPP